ncbi:MAG: response regulator [Ktedonobacteraceae bacterium]|nr:response regulator [Ktedonobacteraceae bacterium]
MAIDDSSTVRKIVEASLGCAGYPVISFPDGVAALRWLAEGNCPVPKLVLLDIGLPKIDGYTLACMMRVKPALRETTIIMMSRRDGLVDRLKGRLAGAQAYIAKPFKKEELVKMVNHYLSGGANVRFGKVQAR